MFKFIKKVLSRIDEKKRNLPRVVFDDGELLDGELEDRLSNLSIDCGTVSEYLGLILSTLGYNNDDQILISDYKYVRGSNDERIFYINCYKNMKLVRRLGFKYESFFDKTPILIVYNDMMEKIKDEYSIHYNKNDGRDYINLELLSVESEYEGKKDKRVFNPRKALFKVEYGDYELLLEVNRCNSDVVTILPNGNYEKFRLNCERELEYYLTDLEFPVRIDEVYKKICEISLGDDASKYYSIYLVVTKNGQITDKIEVREGNCSNFVMTRNGKKIFINEDDSWNYEFIGEDVDDLLLDNEKVASVIFSMSSRNNDITYSVRANTDGEIDNYTNDLVMYDINTAREEVENVKKLIRTILNK